MGNWLVYSKSLHPFQIEVYNILFNYFYYLKPFLLKIIPFEFLLRLIVENGKEILKHRIQSLIQIELSY